MLLWLEFREILLLQRVGSVIYFWTGNILVLATVAIMTKEKNRGEFSYFGFIYCGKLRLIVSYLIQFGRAIMNSFFFFPFSLQIRAFGRCSFLIFWCG